MAGSRKTMDGAWLEPYCAETMAISTGGVRPLAAPDREEVRAAARRCFEAGLCCAVEVEREPGQLDPATWEPRILVFRSGTAIDVLEAVEETIALGPERRVRVAGYAATSLTRTSWPVPVVCSPCSTRPGEIRAPAPA
jgi:hypothetical protein